MRYQEFLPAPELRQYINCYYVIEGDSEVCESRIVPDGCIEMIFHFDRGSRRYLPDGRVEMMPQMLISGQIARYFIMKKPANSGAIGVRFYPWGAAPFLRIPASHLNEHRPSQEDIFGSSIKELHDQVYSAPCCTESIRRIECFLKRILQNSRFQKESYAIKAARLILTNRGTIRSDQWMRPFSISQRRMEQQFLDVVGLSSKFFSRIVRFQNLLQSILHKRKISLTGMAMKFGYFDQAHMIHDFKFFTGQSPKEYLGDTELNWCDYFTHPDHISSLYQEPHVDVNDMI